MMVQARPAGDMEGADCRAKSASRVGLADPGGGVQAAASGGR